ncbi:MAG: ATP cone domain-containing protein [Candidatus Bipolaricaulia bacterium]
MTLPAKKLELIKRSGETEPFTRDKLVASIERAGGSPRLAHEVLADLVFHPDMTTDELRRLVAHHLQEKDPALAQRYRQTHTFWAHSHTSLTCDTACLNPQTIYRLGLDDGDYVQVIHGNRHYRVPVESHRQVSPHEIILLPQTLEILQALVGTRVAVKC